MKVDQKSNTHSFDCYNLLYNELCLQLQLPLEKLFRRSAASVHVPHVLRLHIRTAKHM